MMKAVVVLGDAEGWGGGGVCGWLGRWGVRRCGEASLQEGWQDAEDLG